MFAPAAAYLSVGVPPEEFGPPVGEMIWLNVPPPAEGDGEIEGRVVHVDRYGNLISNIALDDGRAGGVVVEMEGLRVEGLSRSYEEADGVLAIVGSHGTVEIAVRNGSAARQFGAGVGARVRVCYHKPVNSNAQGLPDRRRARSESRWHLKNVSSTTTLLAVISWRRLGSTWTKATWRRRPRRDGAPPRRW